MPPALYLAAITALVIALARPSMVVAIPREEATIILTMDVSRSMRATDVDADPARGRQGRRDDFVDQLPAVVPRRARRLLHRRPDRR